MDGENQNKDQNTDTQQQSTESQSQQSNGGNGDQSQQQNQQQDSGKTFTQEDVNAIGAREKSQGKNSILKLFGCADEKAAKAEAEEFKKWKESQKTEEEKRKEAEEALKSAASDSNKRAIAAENKLTAISAGVALDSLDDALAIALLKVTDENPLDKVFAEMKKEPRYAGFFGTSSSSGGTGSSADHSHGQEGGKNNIGERLAKGRLANTATKSNFFTK